MLLTISMLINLGVLGVIIPAIRRDDAAMVQAYGPATPARGIVVAFYGAIFAISLLVLAAITFGLSWASKAALTILPAQVAHKFLTAFTVGLRNPVVQANLAIALFHAITLTAMLY